MSLHVTNGKHLFSSAAVSNDTASNPIDVSGDLEGWLFIESSVTSGTWLATVQVKNPKTGVWHDRTDISIASMTSATNNKQLVKIPAPLGSSMRINLLESVAGSGNFTVVFEGKS